MDSPQTRNSILKRELHYFCITSLVRVHFTGDVTQSCSCSSPLCAGSRMALREERQREGGRAGACQPTFPPRFLFLLDPETFISLSDEQAANFSPHANLRLISLVWETPPHLQAFDYPRYKNTSTQVSDCIRFISHRNAGGKPVACRR